MNILYTEGFKDTRFKDNSGKAKLWMYFTYLKHTLKPKPMPLQAITEREPMLPLIKTKTRGFRVPIFGAITKIDMIPATAIAIV